MPIARISRRSVVKAASSLAGGCLLSQTFGCKRTAMPRPKEAEERTGPADHTLTIAVKPVEMESASRFGIATLDSEGRVTSYEEKPRRPASNLASLTIRGMISS